MAKITFLFEDTSIASKTVEGDFKDQSILELTEDYDVHLNHNCGGVCACSTCHIYIEKGEQFIEEISDKEEDFIDRAINPRIESRLACQCVILDHKSEIVVTIPDQAGLSDTNTKTRDCNPHRLIDVQIPEYYIQTLKYL